MRKLLSFLLTFIVLAPAYLSDARAQQRRATATTTAAAGETLIRNATILTDRKSVV